MADYGSHIPIVVKHIYYTFYPLLSLSCCPSRFPARFGGVLGSLAGPRTTSTCSFDILFFVNLVSQLTIHDLFCSYYDQYQMSKDGTFLVVQQSSQEVFGSLPSEEEAQHLLNRSV
jgi:hypothetical protein